MMTTTTTTPTKKKNVRALNYNSRLGMHQTYNFRWLDTHTHTVRENVNKNGNEKTPVHRGAVSKSTH